MQALADQLGGAYPDPSYNNGNDAVSLENNGVIVDLLGKIGEDPGTAWSDETGKWWTANHTLIRKPEVINGVKENPAEFIVKMEWDSLPVDTWTNLGMHTIAFPLGTNVIEQPKEVFVYPNPAVSDNIVVKGSAAVKAVRIFNTAGQLVLNERNTTTRGDLYLTLDSKLTGLHMLMVELEGGDVITKKLTIQ